MDRETVIADIEEQIAWIRDNDFHKFPGWGHAVLAMKDAIALLNGQDTIMQCIKGKCRICPHCANCDVDEDGLIKEQDAKTQGADSGMCEICSFYERALHVKPVLDEQTGRIWLCGKCGSYVGFEDNDPNDPNEFDKCCRECGRPVLWEGR